MEDFKWEEGGSRFLKVAEGEKAEFYIKSISKDNGKYNLGDNDWYVKVDTDKGILSITSWGLYFCFKENNIKAGDTVELFFKKMGGLGKPSVYEIKILKSKPITDQGEAEPETDIPF